MNFFSRNAGSSEEKNVWCVVGLGNPGADYAHNRHNVGVMVVDELARRHGLVFKKHKTHSLFTGITRLEGVPYILVKPLSFMNLSGGPVSAVMKFLGITPDRVIVVHDELDLDFDTVRIKTGGGHGGHNGIRDIISATKSPDFVRIRVGIGRPAGRQSAADFVLKNFSSTEKGSLDSLICDAADAVESVMLRGIAETQLRFHTA